VGLPDAAALALRVDGSFVADDAETPAGEVPGSGKRAAERGPREGPKFALNCAGLFRALTQFQLIPLAMSQSEAKPLHKDLQPQPPNPQGGRASDARIFALAVHRLHGVFANHLRARAQAVEALRASKDSLGGDGGVIYYAPRISHRITTPKAATPDGCRVTINQKGDD